MHPSAPHLYDTASGMQTFRLPLCPDLTFGCELGIMGESVWEMREVNQRHQMEMPGAWSFSSSSFPLSSLPRTIYYTELQAGVLTEAQTVFRCCRGGASSQGAKAASPVGAPSSRSPTRSYILSQSPGLVPLPHTMKHLRLRERLRATESSHSTPQRLFTG